MIGYCTGCGLLPSGGKQLAAWSLSPRLVLCDDCFQGSCVDSRTALKRWDLYGKALQAAHEAGLPPMTCIRIARIVSAAPAG